MIELATAPSYPLAPEDASQLVRASIGLDLPLPEPRVAGPARVYAHDPSLDTLAEPCALAIGAFDGVHVGHRSLIERTVADALPRVETVTLQHSQIRDLSGLTALPHLEAIYVLADHSKFDQVAQVRFGSLDAGKIITDREPKTNYRKLSEIIIAKEERA